jgi:DNA-directed RNA polymerase subunit RPC12/RpoP
MRCPGQDSRYWKQEAIYNVTCPHCGNELEFFKDESTRRCKKCGNKIVNPKMDFGCASYCKYAEQCLGDLPPEIIFFLPPFLTAESAGLNSLSVFTI